MLKFALTAIALALGAASSVGAADTETPAGTWKWTGKVGKKDVDQVLKLELKEGKLTGTLSGGKFDLKVEEGTFKDGEVTITATGEFKGEKVVAKLSGKLTGDTIKGTATIDTKGKTKGKPEAWEARREAPEKKKD
ncbi:MAG: hypothetical protein ACKODX_05390 [Gemmata sp.]